jgi:hypothetical protein
MLQAVTTVLQSHDAQTPVKTPGSLRITVLWWHRNLAGTPRWFS